MDQLDAADRQMTNKQHDRYRPTSHAIKDIVDFQNEELCEGQGSKFDALWTGLMRTRGKILLHLMQAMYNSEICNIYYLYNAV